MLRTLGMVGNASSNASSSSPNNFFFVAMAPTSSTSFFYIGNTVSHRFVVSFILFFHSLSACSASKPFFGITQFPATMTLTTSSPQAKKPKIGNYAGYAMPPLNDQRATIGDLSPELLCQTCSGPTFSQGLDTFVVPMALHAWNRQKVVSSLTNRFENKRSGSSLNGESRHANSQIRGMILLEGGKQQTRHDTDHEPVFRQESYFHYLFGASLYSDCYGVITLPEGKTTLFVPTWGVDTETVCGPSPEFERVRAELGLDEVLGVGDLKGFVEGEMGRMREEWLAERKKKGMEVEGEDGIGNLEEKKENADIAGTNGENVGNNASNDVGEPKIYLLKGLNTDSGNFATPAYYKGIEDFATVRDESELFPCIAECRVIKTPAEINLMRYTNWISSMAHVQVMRACRPGMMEYQLESLFQHHTYTHGGCRHMSYTCICACGPSANILHYGHAGRPNSRLLAETDMALLDMGAEYHCYASDITCSFPVKGSFSDDQKSIYQAVLNAQIAVIDQLKPGVSWLDMHRVAEREILKGLVAMGILTTCGMELDAAIDEMLENDLGAIFMPHGLGHLIGIDTHDVGGYAEGTPPRSTRPGLKKCRTARIAEEGMVLTVEPGCYFIDPLMDMALADERQRKFVISERLNQFRGFGGVRLEDNVWVTKDGCENMTICPRSVDEVLDVMKGGVWPPVKDALPELKRKWIGCKGGKVEMLDIKP